MRFRRMGHDTFLPVKHGYDFDVNRLRPKGAVREVASGMAEHRAVGDALAGLTNRPFYKVRDCYVVLGDVGSDPENIGLPADLSSAGNLAALSLQKPFFNVGAQGATFRVTPDFLGVLRFEDAAKTLLRRSYSRHWTDVS
jgi:hypothetical protein